MKQLRRIARLSVSIAATVLIACAQAPIQPVVPPATGPVKTALWVGNSFFYYNNSMHNHVLSMIRAAGTDFSGYRATSATISGSGINWHDVEAHFKPGAVASYSFTSTNDVVFNTFERPFDVAIMMDCSQCPIHPKLQATFHEYVARHAATVRRHGAQPILFMSWAYQDKPEMTAQLAAEYVRAGQSVDASVVPAGLAFAASIERRPELNLYAADKRHPSLAGTYLSAATVLASVYKMNPVGNAYTAGLPTEVAAYLQEVAWATVQAFKQ